jgi:hypothetical protein
MWHDALDQIHAGVERELLTGHEDAPDTAPHSWNWYWLEPFDINHHHYGTIFVKAGGDGINYHALNCQVSTAVQKQSPGYENIQFPKYCVHLCIQDSGLVQTQSDLE